MGSRLTRVQCSDLAPRLMFKYRQVRAIDDNSFRALFQLSNEEAAV